MWGYIIAGLVLLAVVLFVLRRRCKMRQNGLPERIAGKIIDAVPNRIFIVDDNFRVRKIYNPDAVEAATSVCVSVGMNLRDYINPEDADTVLAKIGETFVSGQASEAVYSVVCDGWIRIRWLVSSGTLPSGEKSGPKSGRMRIC